MPETIVVSVSPKDLRNSAKRKEIQHVLSVSGEKAACVSVSALYKLEGRLSQAQIDKIAEELLCDPIAETYAVNDQPRASGIRFVDVWFKPGVMDPAGDSVLKAVRDLNVSSLTRAACGTRFVFRGEVSSSATRELLNPLIQECKVAQA